MSYRSNDKQRGAGNRPSHQPKQSEETMYTLTEKQLKQLIAKAKQEAWECSSEGFNYEYGAEGLTYTAREIGKKDIDRLLNEIQTK